MTMLRYVRRCKVTIHYFFFFFSTERFCFIALLPIVLTHVLSIFFVLVVLFCFHVWLLVLKFDVAFFMECSDNARRTNTENAWPFLFRMSFGLYLKYLFLLFSFLFFPPLVGFILYCAFERISALAVVHFNFAASTSFLFRSSQRT